MPFHWGRTIGGEYSLTLLSFLPSTIMMPIVIAEMALYLNPVPMSIGELRVQE